VVEMNRKWILLALVVIAVLVALVMVVRAVARRKQAEVPVQVEGALTLSSPNFENGGTIPAVYTCDGEDISPALVWDNVPDGTRTFALIMDDPDAPIGTFTHWLICEMPGTARSLPEQVPTGGEISTPTRAVQGRNGFDKTGYGGPCPPRGKAHRYYFTLYALDETLDMPPGFSKHQLRAAVKGHILAEVQLMGRYARQQ